MRHEERQSRKDHAAGSRSCETPACMDHVGDRPADFALVLDGWDPRYVPFQESADLILVRLPYGFVGVTFIR